MLTVTPFLFAGFTMDI